MFIKVKIIIWNEAIFNRYLKKINETIIKTPNLLTFNNYILSALTI